MCLYTRVYNVGSLHTDTRKGASWRLSLSVTFSACALVGSDCVPADGSNGALVCVRNGAFVKICTNGKEL